MQLQVTYERLATKWLLINLLKQILIRDLTSRYVQQEKLLKIPSAVHTFYKTNNAAERKRKRDSEKETQREMQRQRASSTEAQRMLLLLLLLWFLVLRSIVV